MLNRITSAVTVIVLATTIGFSFVHSVQDADESPDQPLVSFTGSFSAIEEEQYLRADTDLLWQSMWQSHAGDDIEKDATGLRIRPMLDFDRCLAIGVFGGASQNSRGYEVDSISELDDRVRVRIRERSFQTSGPKGGAVDVTPYGIFILPATKLPIVIEEDARRLKNEPPNWVEVARLEYENLHW